MGEVPRSFPTRIARGLLQEPLLLPYNPVHRFYRGGRLTERFRGLPDPADHDSPEDWIGSCTEAANPDAEGRAQGLSRIDGAGPGSRGGGVLLKDLLEAWPEEALGATFVARWGVTPGFLVKLLSPAVRLPVHAHPSRAFARRHLACTFGKTEAWIVLEAHSEGGEPPYVGVGFREGVTRSWFREAIERQDPHELRGALHQVPVDEGDVFLVHAGMPHLIGPGLLVLEVQEPTDFGVLAEWAPFLSRPADARMGLDLETALDLYDYTVLGPRETLLRVRQEPAPLREEVGGCEWRLLGPAAARFFDVTRLDVDAELEVADGRFYVGVVMGGEGTLDADSGSRPVRRGETFACSASFAHRFRALGKRLQVIRCMGAVTAP